VRHLLACDAKERAVPHAREAARRALDKRAYSLAADMLRVVIAHGPRPDAALLRMCGDALQRSGRYAEAAQDWRALAGITAGDAHVEARLLEAQARLSAGDVFEGRACLDAALRDAGEPTTSIGAMGRGAAIVRFMTGPRPRWARGEPPPGHAVTHPTGVDRAELDVKLANIVGYYEPLAGMRLQARVRDRCDRNGRREYAAWSDFTFAYFALFLQVHRGPSGLADRYRIAAEERLDGRSAEHHAVRAFPFLLDAVVAQREGRWTEGAAAADRALAVIEEGGLQGTMEHLFVLVHRFQMDLFAQSELPMAASLARMRRASGDSADTALRCHVLSAEVCQRALFGDLEGASRTARRLLESLPRDIWTFQRIAMNVTAALPDVLTTDCRDARRRVRDALVAGRSLRPFENMYLPGFGGVAAMIEACALRAGADDTDIPFIREIARRSRVACPLAHTVGARALAYVEDHLGRPEEAIRLLASAEIDALAFGHRVDAAVARYQRGLRLGGEEGRALCDSARALATECGARAIVLSEDPKHR
jgi:tetratricopeptide (TPR) repeat protein